jgi:hypothetical protein
VTDWYGPGFLLGVVVLAGLGWLILRRKVQADPLGAGIVLLVLSPLTAYALVPLADVVLEHRAYRQCVPEACPQSGSGVPESVSSKTAEQHNEYSGQKNRQADDNRRLLHTQHLGSDH